MSRDAHGPVLIFVRSICRSAFPVIMRAVLSVLVLTSVLAACGYKGPLYLPKPKPEAQRPAPPPAPAPQQPTPGP